MKKSEVYAEIANRLGMDVDKVKFIIKQHERSLAWYLENPDYCGKKVVMEEFAAFRPHLKKMRNSRDKFLNKSENHPVGNKLDKFLKKWHSKTKPFVPHEIWLKQHSATGKENNSSE